MIINTVGALGGEIITILAAKYPQTVHVNWMLVGYCIEGISGSFIVGMAIAHSYAADCTPPQQRAVAFSYFHACLFGGIAIGPALSGYIIEAREKYVGHTEAVLLIFYIALVAHLIFIAFLVFLIPESLSKKRLEAARHQHKEDMERLGPASDWINQIRLLNFAKGFDILWPTGPGSSSALRWNLVLLAATDTIMFGVSMGAMGVVIVYVRRQFNWHEVETGQFVSIVNTSRVLALLVLLPLLTRLIKGKNSHMCGRKTGSDLFDLSIIRLAIFFDMMGYLGYAIARNGGWFAFSGALAAVGGIGSPTLGAALTKHVPQEKVGQLLGVLGLLHAIARVVGPTIFNGIYSATVGSFRQTVFVTLCATFGVAFVCSWLVRPHGECFLAVYVEVKADLLQFILTMTTSALRASPLRMTRRHRLFSRFHIAFVCTILIPRICITVFYCLLDGLYHQQRWSLVQGLCEFIKTSLAKNQDRNGLSNFLQDMLQTPPLRKHTRILQSTKLSGLINCNGVYTSAYRREGCWAVCHVKISLSDWHCLLSIVCSCPSVFEKHCWTRRMARSSCKLYRD